MGTKKLRYPSVFRFINGKARRRSRGKIDYVLWVKVNVDTQPVALALIEAKKENLPPGHGLDQAKGYAECKRHNVRFIFSSNGHQYVEFDCFSGLTSAPRPSKKEIIARNPVDAITGQPITAEQIDELYQRTQYEDRILLPDRVLAMCRDLFRYLLDTGNPAQKSIIFFARDRHADDAAVCMNNLLKRM